MQEQINFSDTIYSFNGAGSNDRTALLERVERLLAMHHAGKLGGEQMPEDANPGLNPESAENYHFFTLPMALNYQRNSYALWVAATATFNDVSTRFVFNPSAVVGNSIEEVRIALLKHKLALQPNKHIQTWIQICTTVSECYGSDIRRLIESGNKSIQHIRQIIQRDQKAGFPYLSGPKIFNYWLYVLEQYTGLRFADRHLLSVAPDTHVVQATVKLGLMNAEALDAPRLQENVSEAWRILLDGTKYVPIDLHTPLWLWSRNGFPPING